MRNHFIILCLVSIPLWAKASPAQSSSIRDSETDPYAQILRRLSSLESEPLPDWQSHADLPHPEDVDSDGKDWAVLRVVNEVDASNPGAGNQEWVGARVFRRSIVIPKAINGYGIEGSRVFLDLQFTSRGILLPGNLIVTIFSNGSILYRGTNDNLNPMLLTADAHAGQRFLLAARVVGGEDIQWSFARSALTIESPKNRPDPGFLCAEILGARLVIGAYQEGRQERERQLDAAVHAIDFIPLEKGDQAGFDASLDRATQKLQVLKPWLSQFSIRAVGNSHIDLAWLWSWTETVEIVHNTFLSVLDLMREYPDFKFTMSSAQAYEWMEEKYPDLFEQIRQRVKEGRWEIVGGMWVEPDLNMPCGESLVRQLLVGKEYFLKNFGVDVNIGWNPDSFGYSWQLPQIYKKSGVNYFVTQKLLWAHDFTTFPYKLFWWQSPDGSRILTYFPHGYGNGIDAASLGNDLSVWAPSIYGQNTGIHPEMMHLYGVGDHGGGPTRTMLDRADRLMAPDAVFPKFQFSTAQDFFADVDEKLPQMKVPVWNSELYFQSHRGVFTSQSETKKRIRRAEEQVLDAEKFASLAQLYGLPYPQRQLESAWKAVLFDQFHDVMPGTGIGVNYRETKKNLDTVGLITDEITRDSLAEIAAHADTMGPGIPLMVFNSLSWPRTEIIEANVQLPSPARAIEVQNAHGELVISQLLSIDPQTNRAHFLVQVHVPALGYQTYFVRGVAQALPPKTSLNATPTSLENEFLRLTIDSKTGCMTSLIIKATGTNVLAPSETDTGGPKASICGNLLQTFVDKPRLMGIWNLDAWNIDSDFEKHRWDLDYADEVKLVENGPLRSIIRVKNHFGSSTFIRDITLYPGVPRVDVKMQVEWHEKHILLKVAFPLRIHSDFATFEIPYGSIERPTTRNTPEEKAQFEVPALRWADLSNKQYGFSLLNDSKYGYDAKGNVLRLSLLRSPTFPDPHTDEGFHEFVYSLYPHSGTWRDALTVQQGYDLNYKLIPLVTAAHQGSLDPEHSFVTVSSDRVVVTAVKKAEEDDAMIFRFYDWDGNSGNIRIQLPLGAISASEVNLMERSPKPLPIENGTVTIPTKPYEIKTLRVEFATR